MLVQRRRAAAAIQRRRSPEQGAAVCTKGSVALVQNQQQRRQRRLPQLRLAWRPQLSEDGPVLRCPAGLQRGQQHAVCLRDLLRVISGPQPDRQACHHCSGCYHPELISLHPCCPGGNVPCSNRAVYDCR